MNNLVILVLKFKNEIKTNQLHLERLNYKTGSLYNKIEIKQRNLTMDVTRGNFLSLKKLGYACPLKILIILEILRFYLLFNL